MGYCIQAVRTGWCILCYEGVKARRYHRGHYGWHQPTARERQRRRDMALRKPAGDKAPLKVAKATVMGLEKLYPTLWEYMTATTWEDGSPREVATLLVFWEDGVWKACLNDRASNRSAWLSCVDLEDVPECLETGLADDTLGWRAKSREKGTGRKYS